MIGIRIDQTLTQDATGTLVMLELEAMDLKRAQTEVSVQYVDHNLIQTDHKNADDHLFLQSACQRLASGSAALEMDVSHPVHMQNFGQARAKPCSAPTVTRPLLALLDAGDRGWRTRCCHGHCRASFLSHHAKDLGIKLTGKLPDWVSAKDVILEMLRRYTVKAGSGISLNTMVSGLKELSPMDRHVIANMGQSWRTSTVFPSDEAVRDNFCAEQDRQKRIGVN